MNIRCVAIRRSRSCWIDWNYHHRMMIDTSRKKYDFDHNHNRGNSLTGMVEIEYNHVIIYLIPRARTREKSNNIGVYRTTYGMESSIACFFSTTNEHLIRR